MLNTLFRTLGAVAALGLSFGVSGCDGADITINGEKGVPLAELDLAGKAPQEIALLGPDRVHVIKGDKLAISIEGEDAVKAQLRFHLDDGKLGISREKWKVGGSTAAATITVTMPSPRKLVMAGSGQIDSDSLVGEDADITIAGSGTISSPATSVGTLNVNVVGSGKAIAGGTAKVLKTTIGGSGDADLAQLHVDKADVTVAGSGSARFASDGEVKATIMGSGEVRVTGRARCTIKAMGSGRLVCDTPATGARDEDKDTDTN